MFDGLFDDVKASTKLWLLVGVMFGVAVQFSAGTIIAIVVMATWQLYGASVAAFLSRLPWVAAVYLMHALTMFLVWPASRAESWREAMPWLVIGCCVYLATHVFLRKERQRNRSLRDASKKLDDASLAEYVFYRWLPVEP